MARYKPYDVNQDKFIAVSFCDQILPGSFEQALCEIVDQPLDLSPFAQRYANDETGRWAYDPAVLLKIVLYGYYKGLLSSRRLAETCERNIQFMARSADTRPHFTTITDFISQPAPEQRGAATGVRKAEKAKHCAGAWLQVPKPGCRGVGCHSVLPLQVRICFRLGVSRDKIWLAMLCSL